MANSKILTPVFTKYHLQKVTLKINLRKCMCSNVKMLSYPNQRDEMSAVIILLLMGFHLSLNEGKSAWWIIGKWAAFLTTPLPAHSSEHYKLRECSRGFPCTLLQDKCTEAFKKIKMYQFFRIALWMCLCLGCLRANPLRSKRAKEFCSLDLQDAYLNSLQKVSCVSCGACLCVLFLFL